MNKKDLLKLMKKGDFETNGYIGRVVMVTPYYGSRENPIIGNQFLTLEFDAMSPLHSKIRIGEQATKQTKSIHDKKLIELLNSLKKEADDFCESAKEVVRATMNQDGTFTLSEMPKMYENIQKEYPIEAELWIKQKFSFKKSIHIPKGWVCSPPLGVFTLDIDGVLYIPHFSDFLKSPYYLLEEDRNA